MHHEGKRQQTIMWNLRPLVFLVFMLSLFIPYPAFSESQEPVSEQEAILEHLRAMQQELKALRGEVGQLRKAVRELHRSTIGQQGNTRTPQPARLVDVTLGDGPSLGEATATVGIVEFTDYQCPFCKRFHEQTFSQINTNYIETGKIQHVIRDFPLGFHAQAKRSRHRRALRRHSGEILGDLPRALHQSTGIRSRPLREIGRIT